MVSKVTTKLTTGNLGILYVLSDYKLSVHYFCEYQASLSLFAFVRQKRVKILIREREQRYANRGDKKVMERYLLQKKKQGKKLGSISVS